jgi:hydroxyacyl-ACP dehydratase HTD2-like protein with hotdog domain
VEIAAIQRDWVGKEFDVSDFRVSQADMLEYAHAVGETDPRFVDPEHPDFQAPPTFTAKFLSRRILPESFPFLGSRGFDAGKSVVVHAPLRPNTVLRAHSKIAEIYEKTGRTGSMVFIVHRMEFETDKGEAISTVDWRMVRQPDPA